MTFSPLHFISLHNFCFLSSFQALQAMFQANLVLARLSKITLLCTTTIMQFDFFKKLSLFYNEQKFKIRKYQQKLCGIHRLHMSSHQNL